MKRWGGQVYEENFYKEGYDLGRGMIEISVASSPGEARISIYELNKDGSIREGIMSLLSGTECLTLHRMLLAAANVARGKVRNPSGIKSVPMRVGEPPRRG